MRKLLALALVAILALSLLTACKVNIGDNGGNGGGNTPDLSSVIGGTGKPSDYDAATRKALIDEAKADGGNLEFKSDGSMVYTDPDGNTTIQNADGSWAIDTGDEDDAGNSGTQVEVGNSDDWPDNEFTRLIPKPDIAMGENVVAGTTFVVTFTDATIDQIKEYVEQLEAAGFTVDADTQDMAGVYYTYDADNADGYHINVFYANGSMGFSLSRLD